MTAPSFIRQLPQIAPDDEYELDDSPPVIGTFDLEWRRADRSVGEAESGFVAGLMFGRLGGLHLSREMVERALGRDALREWEAEVGREASEQ